MTSLKKFAGLAAAVTLPLMTAACTDPKGASEALQNEGFDNVQMTGYRVWGCSDDDDFHTGFTATNAKGRPVSGVVCSGFLKGSTIRYDHH